MPNYNKKKHDIGILRSDGTTYVGMMLARENNIPLYRKIFDKYFPPPRYASAPDYGALDPEHELWLIQNDWRSSFGLYTYDSSDTKRYFESIGIDLSERGQASMGYKATGISPDVHTNAAYNQGVRTADPDAGWSNDDNVLDGATGTKATNAQADNGKYLYVYVPAISCSKIRYYWTEDANNDVTDLEIGVYYDGAWNVVVSDDSAGEGALAEASLGATKTVTAARVKLTATAQPAHIHVLEFYAESATLQGVTRKGVDFNSEHYVPRGNTLIKLNATGDGFDVVGKGAFAADITRIEPMTVSGTAYLFIFLGTSNAYWYMVIAETFTESTATYKTYQFAALVHSATPAMYANDGTNTMRSTVNPLNAGTEWSNPATTVDSVEYDITDLIAAENTLYMPKEDRTFYLDSTPAVQTLVDDQVTEYATTSGKNTIYHRGKIYIPCGNQSLLECDGDGASPVWRNPGLQCTNQASMVGRVQALAGDGFWLFGATDYSGAAEIWKSRLETIDGSSVWVIHPFQQITITNVETMWISTTFQKRLWIASDTATENIFYIPLPTGYGNLTADGNRSYNTTGTYYFITPWLHGNFRATTKAFAELTCDMGHAYDADIYWEVHYQILGDTTWTDIGDFKGASGNMRQTIAIPADSGSAEPSSNMIRLKFIAHTDAATKTPILLSYHVRAILYPTTRNIIECVVRCADGDIDKDGLPLKGTSAEYIRTVLEEARDATFPFTFYDPWGTSHTVKILSMSPFAQITKQTKGKNAEEWYNLKLQKTTIHT